MLFRSDQKVEDMDARFERGIEASAAKLEKGVTHKYGESRLFRYGIPCRIVSVWRTVPLDAGSTLPSSRQRSGISRLAIRARSRQMI